jgi:hypothetical protein
VRQPATGVHGSLVETSSCGGIKQCLQLKRTAATSGCARASKPGGSQVAHMPCEMVSCVPGTVVHQLSMHSSRVCCTRADYRLYTLPILTCKWQHKGVPKALCRPGAEHRQHHPPTQELWIIPRPIGQCAAVAICRCPTGFPSIV